MKTRSIFFAGITLLAIVLSACSAVAPAASSPNRSLTVAGAGTAYLVPDIAYIYIGVHTEKPSASESVTENNTQTQNVIKALTDFGIDSKDIRTTNFSIYPFDKYDPLTNTPTGQKYYSVDNTVYVTIRELTKLGDLLDTVVTAGANTVNSIQFDVADKEVVLKQAREDAMKNAARQAQELADAAGVKLGGIQTISFSDSQPYPVYDGRGGGGGGAEAPAVPIQPGQLTFTVTVTVAYEIK